MPRTTRRTRSTIPPRTQWQQRSPKGSAGASLQSRVFDMRTMRVASSFEVGKDAAHLTAAVLERPSRQMRP
jgi:hypothetical protein